MNTRRTRGRGNPRSRHPNNFRNTQLDSNGPEGRIRGTANQIHDRYLVLARDAQAVGDGVLAENLLQHAEHYFRVMNFNGTANQQSQPQQQFGRSQVSGEDDGRDEGDGFESVQAPREEFRREDQRREGGYRRDGFHQDGESGAGRQPRFEGGNRRDGDRFQSDRPRGDRGQSDRFQDRSQGERPQNERFQADRQQGDRHQGERHQGERFQNDRQPGERFQGERGQNERFQGSRGYGDRNQGDRTQGDRNQGDRNQGDRGQGERGQSERGQGERFQGDRSQGEQQGYARRELGGDGPDVLPRRFRDAGAEPEQRRQPPRDPLNALPSFLGPPPQAAIGAASRPGPVNGGMVPSDDENVGSSRVDLQACKLEYSIVSPK